MAVRKIHGKQGYETLVFALLRACEVFAQCNQRPSRLIRGTVTNRVFFIFHISFELQVNKIQGKRYMTDWTCFAYYSSNNTFCSTPPLSTSLVVNVFFLFAGNARLHEKQRLFSFFSFFVMPWISRTTLWTTGKFHLVLFGIRYSPPLPFT